MESRLGVCADTTGGVHPLWVVNISLATTTFLGDSAHIDQRINQLDSSPNLVSDICRRSLERITVRSLSH